MSTAADADRRKLGLVVLGASRFEYYSDLANPAFLASAHAFRTTITNQNASLFGERIAILDLFDSTDNPLRIFTRVREFVDAEPDLTDVLVYYCGHGCFLRDR